MINIIEKYKDFCLYKGIEFKIDDSVKPYDETTLFCPAGMQQFKSLFKNQEHTGTLANIQSCIRMNDIDEIGDSTHLLYFNMIGLFSFNQLSIQEAIDFWYEFLTSINIKPSYVTIHPDKKEWKNLYDKYGAEVRLQEDCKWTDGEIGGYCTEFFVDDVEIGNIVNPLDTCIDVGFGLERLELFVNGKKINKIETLKNTINKIITSGYTPSNVGQGYVLRRLIRQLIKEGETIEHQFFYDEIEKQT